MTDSSSKCGHVPQDGLGKVDDGEGVAAGGSGKVDGDVYEGIAEGSSPTAEQQQLNAELIQGTNTQILCTAGICN